MTKETGLHFLFSLGLHVFTKLENYFIATRCYHDRGWNTR